MADMPAPPYCSGYFADVRPDFSFGELADAAAQQFLLFGGTKVHQS
jgi:hypothetical protein